MSYLEMVSTDLPDMTKGIISFWVKDAGKKTAPPEPWPLKPMPVIQEDARGDGDVTYWNNYWLPLDDFIFTNWHDNSCVMMPINPPIMHDGVNMLLTFGDPNQKYEEAQWDLVKNPGGCMQWVEMKDTSVAIGIGFLFEDYPPPYAPYHNDPRAGGDGISSQGIQQPANVDAYRVSKGAGRTGIIPPSYVGIVDGKLTVCLQTKTRGDYKGYCWMNDRIANLMVQAVAGGPNANGDFQNFYIPGLYWTGYEWHYEDVSNIIMTQAPDVFVLGGQWLHQHGIPNQFEAEVHSVKASELSNRDYFLGDIDISGDTWHHVLISFDLSGTVTSEHDGTFTGTGGYALGPVTSGCKAWITVDGKTYTGKKLRACCGGRGIFGGSHAIGLAWIDGMGNEEPRGMRETGGPVSLSDVLQLGPHDIIPMNVYLQTSGSMMPTGHLKRFAGPELVRADNMPRSGWLGGYGPGDYDPRMWITALAQAHNQGLHQGGSGAGAGPEIWPIYYVDGVTRKPQAPDPKTLQRPKYQGGPYVIPTKGHPIGIPASGQFADHQTGCEMAELQIWANQSLDVSVPDNVRLFLTKDGKPEKMSVAEKALGKPDIRLHTSTGWMHGSNTGSTGLDAEGKPKQSQQFTPVAAIYRYKPDPQLGVK